MSRYSYGNWRPYVPVGDRRRQAAKKIAKMKKAGREVAPVEIAGRKIATTFWGDAWCKNLESYSDFSNRLPRGRTYVRNGSVLDLQVEAGRVRSLVSGTEIYKVEIKIKPLAKKRWTGIKKRCAGQIGSLVELLQGSISSGVMEIVTRKRDGLFPAPREISLSCSCPDWATMCKHVAATLYGVGARLDHQPELLFTLRKVDPTEMVETAIDQPPTGRKSPRGRVLADDDLSAVFGVDIDFAGEDPRPPARARKAASRKPASRKAASRKPASRKPASRKPATTRKPGRKKPATIKPARSPQQALERLRDRTVQFVEDSMFLREQVWEVQAARGRLYLRQESGDLMARITPVGPRAVLLETPHGRSWTERKRGLLATVLKAAEADLR